MRVLLEELDDATADCHVLFAGGIHDARSAAMVAAAAAAARRARGPHRRADGHRLPVHRARPSTRGAITPLFQRARDRREPTRHCWRAARDTRPVACPRRSPSSSQARAAEPERGRGRTPRSCADASSSSTSAACGSPPRAWTARAADGRLARGSSAASAQWQDGMYMIGQVAALRGSVTTVAELHEDVCRGSSELLAAVSPPEAEPDPEPPPPADVAIVGIGCILPGAARRRRPSGRTSSTRSTRSGRCRPSAGTGDGCTTRTRRTKDKVYSRWGGFIDPVAFDPIALGMPPKSLASIEPFQLLALLVRASPRWPTPATPSGRSTGSARR